MYLGEFAADRARGFLLICRASYMVHELLNDFTKTVGDDGISHLTPTAAFQSSYRVTVKRLMWAIVNQPKVQIPYEPVLYRSHGSRDKIARPGHIPSPGGSPSPRGERTAAHVAKISSRRSTSARLNPVATFRRRPARYL